jgi:hypothetical protein
VRIQRHQNGALEDWRFDLTPTFAAGAQWAQAMGAESTPSAYLATRAQQGDPAAQTAHALRLWREGAGLAPETVGWLQSASDAGILLSRELLAIVYLALGGAPGWRGARTLPRSCCVSSAALCCPWVF